MQDGRRKFLKAAGCAALAAGASPAVVSCARESKVHGVVSPKRYAMVIDVKKCISHESCSTCIDACNRTHNVPDWGNPKDEIKWLWKEELKHAFPSLEDHILPDRFAKKGALVLCNHCDNPPCVRVCPTKATWKREDGIVMMDWHRCIGCRYCVVACPYGSRSFNWFDPRKATNLNSSSPETTPTPEFPTRAKGVVEKCTFCEERITKGLQPACVEACPHGALVFGNLDDTDSNVRRLLAHNFTIRRKPDLGTLPQVFYVV